ncbi:metallopeptidase M24 family protein [Coccidioides posadasii C735 delta SOWgp]|uniref:Probable Xaa-Pro aminopeptidase PEPP n=1 Tax=Coccidioides posadasii (strain C735) TaxID=222929 RepID=AMPP3_COCP7|nr:metallopeptidase M24 family protein [Coccidioides posadasii C735 delta SOWgp]C5PHM7.1 RecName: Full=Probable Xaa-Pro aminopeptidase PEPP; AltName: Full=Aminoacylproline aminopeptidase; AltName: Full=Prolidase [Coccidioides posadasii C735 delta SOWgp]EER24030.1 metallopeptidase M24 family protein [Coccidioides posadasii C735 delta SOWgp]|eukprot:XP_003066175.1 metallopeptidase M24 family protein [Coccidioides posadasii C735 delta SOWgp]
MDSAVTAVLAGKYPAKQHARRVAEALKASGHDGSGVIYLEGTKTRMAEDSDEAVPFRQRRNFYYLSGCELADSYVTYNIDQDELVLYIPAADPDEVMWTGLPLSPEEALKKYDVDKVLASSEINAHLAHYCTNKETAPKRVYAIPDRVCAETTFLPFDDTNWDALSNALNQCRKVKDDYEIALLKRSNEISALAHLAVMKAAKLAKNERELEAVFRSTCLSHGSRGQSYGPIVAAGVNGATLHYQTNDMDLEDPVTGERPSLLVDAGGEYRLYCSDITRAYPLSGKFSVEARQIYDIVLDMQTQCMDMIKPGVAWDDIHARAHKVAISGLLRLGILRGSEEELFEKRISVAFFPHGLGHYMGMDTHDVGGNPNHADPNPMFRYLRLRGTLSPSEVVTVEPGVYFCRFIIEPYLSSPELGKYIDSAVLDKYWKVGGVRIEDNLVITQDGYLNLTTAPKDPEEVERIVQQG